MKHTTSALASRVALLIALLASVACTPEDASPQDAAASPGSTDSSTIVVPSGFKDFEDDAAGLTYALPSVWSRRVAHISGHRQAVATNGSSTVGVTSGCWDDILDVPPTVTDRRTFAKVTIPSAFPLTGVVRRAHVTESGPLQIDGEAGYEMQAHAVGIAGPRHLGASRPVQLDLRLLAGQGNEVCYLIGVTFKGVASIQVNAVLDSFARLD